jgi:hypothetical protein
MGTSAKADEFTLGGIEAQFFARQRIELVTCRVNRLLERQSLKPLDLVRADDHCENKAGVIWNS